MPANTSPIGISNVNLELNYSANTLRAFDDAIFRNLSGDAATNVLQSRIGFSDIDGKIAFGGFTFANATNSSFGISQPSVNLVCVSDMFSPTVVWSYTVVSGSINLKLNTTGPKNAQLVLSVNDIGTSSSNVAVTTTLSYAGHQIGTNTQYVSLSGTVLDPGLTVSGLFSVNNSGYTAQSAFTTIRAAANTNLPAGNTSIQFIVDPGVGTAINGNSITFSCSTNIPGNDNTQSYSLTTNLLYNGSVIASNVSTVVIRTTYIQPTFAFGVVSTTNNQFANSGSVVSSLNLTADHSIPGANVIWSVIPISGTVPSITVSANNESANVYLATSAFGFQKSVANVVASIAYANGYVLASNSAQVTLRTGTYGLTFTPANTSVTANGYGAQTVTTTAVATWQAGTFAWNTALVSGNSAAVSNTILANSATLTLTLTSGATPANLSSVYSINPTITFDGIVIANVTSVSTLTVNNLPYSFAITGPTQNNQIANIATIIQQVSQNVASGLLTFTIDNPSISLTSNTTAATLVLANTADGANIQSANLTINLVDSTSRTVNTQVIPVSLRIYNPNNVFTGANSVSILGYAAGQSANTTISAKVASGSNNFTFSAVHASGSAATIKNVSSNNTQQIINVFVAEPAGSYGTTQSLYNMTSVVTFYDKTATFVYPISVAATQLNPNLMFSFANGSTTNFGPIATANGSATATHSVPGGTISWSTTPVSGTISGTPTSNSSNYQFSESANSIGSQTAIVAVTAKVLDANGLFVASNTANVKATANFTNPNLAFSGATNVLVSNVFASTAQTTITATVNSLFTNAIFSFAVSKISGVDATIVNSANSVTLSVAKSGVGSANAVYNVTCTVHGADPTVVSSTSTQVSLNANCPLPPLTITPTNSINSSYNYPVTASASVFAKSTPAGSVTWNYSLIGGSSAGVTVSSNTSQINFGLSESAIGSLSATYSVTANYYSPLGAFLASLNTNVVVTATRLDPAFVMTYPLGQGVVNYGWETSLTSLAQIQASVSPGVPTSGLVYNWSLSQSGSTGTLSSNATTGFANLVITNDRTSEGTAGKSTTMNATCSVSLNGQVIGGPIPAAVSAQIVPYYINLSASPSNNYSYTDGSGPTIFVSAVTNHPSISGQNFIWTITQTGGTAGTDTIASSGSSNSTIGMYLYPPPYIGAYNTLYAIAASITANGATRTSNTLNTQQTANSTVNSGGGGGTGCVVETSWLDEFFQACDVMDDMVFQTWSPETDFELSKIEKVGERLLQNCIRLKTVTGAELICSESTPFNLKEAKTDLDPAFSRLAPEMLDQEVLVIDKYSQQRYWDRVTECESIGPQYVVPISFGGKSFAAGVKKELLIFSHNMMKPIQ